jgi:hypothetical protein
MHRVIPVLLLAATHLAVNPARAQEKKEETRFAMRFDKTSWAKVFEWYADQTGLPYASKWPPPAGVFSHSPPNGRTYTLHEVTVIINDSLIKDGYVLVPRQKTTTLVKIAKQ